ncbi:MAG: T9SS type A sorting domain-containing protein [Flavobacteriales bacterium]
MNKALLPFLLLPLAVAPGRLTAQEPTAVNYVGLEYMTALNDVNGGDGYPWLNADGTHLYYSRSTDAGIRTFYTERADASSPWSAPVDLLPLETGNTMGACLSPDELTIWFTSTSSQVRKATRTSITDPFSASSAVLLQGTSGTFNGPSLSPDGSYMTVLRFSAAIELERVAPDTYAYIGPLTMLGNPITNATRMSQDGLHLYFSASLGGVVRPHRMTRSSTSEPFGDPQYLAGTDFVSGYPWLQAHLSADEQQLMVVRGGSTWAVNELFYTNASATGVEELWAPRSFLFPTPASQQVTVELPAHWPSGTLQVWDARGALALQQKLTEATTTVPVNHLPAGPYQARLQHGTEVLHLRLMVVR